MITIPGFKKVAVTPPAWSVAKADVRLEMGKKKASVALVWQKPAASNIVTFNLYRKGPSDADFAVLAAINETKYTDEAVEIGKSYSYALSSVDDSFTETERGEVRTVEVKDVEIKTTKRPDKLTLSVRGTKVIRRHKGGDVAKEGQAIDIKEPFDVIVDNKKELLYTTSTNTRRVVVFNLKGDFVRFIGRDGAPTEEGVLLYPLGMAIDKDGRVYVCDGRRNDIQVFDSDGKVLRRIALHKEEGMKDDPVPKDCAVAPDGSLYVLDYANHQVHLYDAAGKFVTRFSKLGVEPGDLRFPNYMALSNDGSRLYVINSGECMVSVFDKGGKFIGTWGGKKNDIGKFVFIAGVAVDANDNVFVSDLNTEFCPGIHPAGAVPVQSRHRGSRRGGRPLRPPWPLCRQRQSALLDRGDDWPGHDFAVAGEYEAVADRAAGNADRRIASRHRFEGDSRKEVDQGGVGRSAMMWGKGRRTVARSHCWKEEST